MRRLLLLLHGVVLLFLLLNSWYGRFYHTFLLPFVLSFKYWTIYSIVLNGVTTAIRTNLSCVCCVRMCAFDKRYLVLTGRLMPIIARSIWSVLLICCLCINTIQYTPMVFPTILTNYYFALDGVFIVTSLPWKWSLLFPLVIEIGGSHSHRCENALH